MVPFHSSPLHSLPFHPSLHTRSLSPFYLSHFHPKHQLPPPLTPHPHPHYTCTSILTQSTRSGHNSCSTDIDVCTYFLSYGTQGKGGNTGHTPDTQCKKWTHVAHTAHVQYIHTEMFTVTSYSFPFGSHFGMVPMQVQRKSHFESHFNSYVCTSCLGDPT